MDKEVQERFTDKFSLCVNEICRKNSLKELTDYVNAYALEDKRFEGCGYCMYCALSSKNTKKLFKNNSCYGLCSEYFSEFDNFVSDCNYKHKIGYYLLVKSLETKHNDSLLDIE